MRGSLRRWLRYFAPRARGVIVLRALGQRRDEYPRDLPFASVLPTQADAVVY